MLKVDQGMIGVVASKFSAKDSQYISKLIYGPDSLRRKGGSTRIMQVYVCRFPSTPASYLSFEDWTINERYDWMSIEEPESAHIFKILSLTPPGYTIFFGVDDLANLKGANRQ